ncbi:MAG TPA: hypothetical protein VGH42_14940 [Verrucomicrobiae bacterium]|jgi:hypothetical protein
MEEPYPKLLVEVRSSRELYVSVFGTPDSLRIVVASLLSSVDALPSPLANRQLLKDFYVANANGSKQETYLSFHAEPSLDYLAGRKKRYAIRDFVVVILLIAFVAFAVVGVMTIWHWII